MITYALQGTTGRLNELGAGERAVFTALRQLTQPLDVHQRCTATLDAARALFDTSASWILLHDEGSRRLDVCVYQGEGADCYAGLRVPNSEGLVGRALSRRELVFVPAVNGETGWYDVERMRQSGLRSVVLVPLVYDNRGVGVLALQSPRFSEAGPPDAVDLARLEALAALAAITIENARLFEHCERDRAELREALEQRQQLREEVSALQRCGAAAAPRYEMIGSSPSMERVRAEIGIVAGSDASVLVLGETGTGKELVARAIHRASARDGRPFVAVNCAALPEALVESELFGHERGAFTGAVQARAGKFELADRGTLFLDEVGDLPCEAQAKLLRVLQDHRLERVGSTRQTTVDVRIVAATNMDLERAMAAGMFRADLYYRLSVFPIRLPPLRERREDIPLLAMYFAMRCADQVGKHIEGFAPATLDRLLSHDWPGNVRELQNVVERAVLLTSGTVVRPDVVGLLEVQPRASQLNGAVRHTSGPPALQSRGVTTLDNADREAILMALDVSGWRVSGQHGAARALGLKPTTLHSKMKRLGIVRPRGPNLAP
jgi:formate hydrogenlyase transcriptional activator